MKVSLKWLRDYVQIDISAKELADRLTMAGLEVESVEEIRPSFTDVVVAKILSIRPHPNADKLRLCEASIGDSVLPIVYGAPNIEAGQIVPLAKVGATIPGGYTIKSSKIRGELSEGMLCSEEELGIGSDNTGIMILPQDLTLGVDLKDALELDDAVLDIGITPNRSDCLSVIGIAREIAAITGRKINYPSFAVIENNEDVHGLTSVTIMDPDLCPRYTARIIKNVTIKPSPLWMRQRLEAVGLRAINNVVDVTNFIMMEMGQPLHSFDFRFLEEGRIVVRRSKDEEHFVSLDEKDRVLKKDTLMICDGVKPVAIAGIMGGLNSEVKDDTRTILLESAYFNPTSIRKSSRWLAMGTDAAFRFERGIDPGGVVNAQNRAARLIAELSGGEVCKNLIDCYPQPLEPVGAIPLRFKKVNSFLGTAVDSGEMIRILESLQMAVNKVDGDACQVTPPTFRVDIAREIDLIEEIARIYGYDKIPVTMPSVTLIPLDKKPKAVVENLIRNRLSGEGYTEIVTYSFIAPGSMDILGLREDDERRRLVKIMNPLTEDQSVMRSSLAYSLLKTMKTNAYAGNFDLKLFEMGRAYIHNKKGLLPTEKGRLGILLTGQRYADLCYSKDLSADFYDLKGNVENLLNSMQISDMTLETADPEPFLHPGRSCQVRVAGEVLGYLGEVHPGVMAKMDLKNRAMICEIDLDRLAATYSGVIQYKDVPKYPSSSRDVAFLVGKDVEAGKMTAIAIDSKEELLEKVCVFDVYDGKGIPAGMKSLGLRFSYRAVGRTLTDGEISDVHGRLIKQIITLCDAKIRGDDNI